MCNPACTESDFWLLIDSLNEYTRSFAEKMMDMAVGKALKGVEHSSPEKSKNIPIDLDVRTPDRNSCINFNSFFYDLFSWHRVIHEKVAPNKLSLYLSYWL